MMKADTLLTLQCSVLSMAVVHRVVGKLLANWSRDRDHQANKQLSI